ncbi:hypothetical protein [uncultured Corynebacterium sp.]|uniref:hypothetical protein n=1 Tax=uncultured Corynebacterium sp. TaxID=159447 RepID=UPI0025EB47AD|nr:hypothetical protein [uncultured Corynebacterium sp.]
MPKISGTLSHVTGDPDMVTSIGVAAVKVRPGRGGIITSSPKTFKVENGQVSFPCEPGEAVLTLHYLNSAVEAVPILVADAASQTLEAAMRAAQLAEKSTLDALTKIAQEIADGIAKIEGFAQLADAEKVKAWLEQSSQAAERAEKAAKETIAQVEGDFATRPYVDSQKWDRGYIKTTDNIAALTPGAYKVSPTEAKAFEFPLTGYSTLEEYWLTNSNSSQIQRLTGSVSGTIEVYQRFFVGGKWEDWSKIPSLKDIAAGDNLNADVWDKGPLTESTDIDSLKPGAYGVPSSTVSTALNLPITGLGTLQAFNVTTSGSAKMQEIIAEVNREWVTYRRFFVGGKWGDWSKVGADTAGTSPVLESDSNEILSSFTHSGSGISGAGLYLRNTIETDVTGKPYPATVTPDGKIVLTKDSGNIKKSTDGGRTWTKIWDFGKPGGFTTITNDGEILATAGGNGEPRELWKSTGFANDGEVTFTKVLTSSGPDMRFALGWGYYIHENRILISEYGQKTTASSADQNLWPRFLYQSLDHGKTWTTIFDLAGFLDTLGRTTHTGQHLHGVAYDKYWGRIWVTWGDDTNGLAYSDDDGKTWELGYYGDRPDSEWQAVGIQPMPECILLGSDSAPNGVWRIDRRQGRNPEKYVPKIAYLINDERTMRTNLCHGFTRVPGANGKPDLYLIGFSAESNPGDSIVLGTWDGYAFNVMWRSPAPNKAGQGYRGIITMPDGTVMINFQTSKGRQLVTGTSWTVAQQSKE